MPTPNTDTNMQHATVRLLIGGAKHVRVVGGEGVLQAWGGPTEEVVRRANAAAERHRIPAHGACHGYHLAGGSIRLSVCLSRESLAGLGEACVNADTTVDALLCPSVHDRSRSSDGT